MPSGAPGVSGEGPTPMQPFWEQSLDLHASGEEQEDPGGSLPLCQLSATLYRHLLILELFQGSGAGISLFLFDIPPSPPCCCRCPWLLLWAQGQLWVKCVLTLCLSRGDAI